MTELFMVINTGLMVIAAVRSIVANV